MFVGYVLSRALVLPVTPRLTLPLALNPKDHTCLLPTALRPGELCSAAGHMTPVPGPEKWVLTSCQSWLQEPQRGSSS